MVVILNLCATAVDLCFQRGDTEPWTFTIVNKTTAVAIDITGFSFLLTVDPSDEPVDAVNNLFQLTGTVTDGPGGVVQFAMSAANADQTPQEYFFDLQQTDAGGAIRTIAKGVYEFQQDITK